MPPAASDTGGGRRRDLVALWLGLLWLFDGLMQLQPHMWTRAFFTDQIAMSSMGLPGPLAHLEDLSLGLLARHAVVGNGVIALAQLVLGIGIIRRTTRRTALMLSVPWALLVWTVGEGLGGLLMPGASLLAGAPGAALLYALLAVTVVRGGTRSAVGVWAGTWTLGALLELERVNHLSWFPGTALAAGGAGQPGPLAVLDRLAGESIGNHGYAFACFAGALQLGIAAAALHTRTRGWAVLSGTLFSAAVWVVGQNLGSVLTGQGTDPSTGPLLILLGLLVGEGRAWSLPRVSRREGQIPRPAGQATPVPPRPQYPLGFLARYCWW